MFFDSRCLPYTDITIDNIMLLNIVEYDDSIITLHLCILCEKRHAGYGYTRNLVKVIKNNDIRHHRIPK